MKELPMQCTGTEEPRTREDRFQWLLGTIELQDLSWLLNGWPENFDRLYTFF